MHLSVSGKKLEISNSPILSKHRIALLTCRRYFKGLVQAQQVAFMMAKCQHYLTLTFIKFIAGTSNFFGQDVQ